jgi:abortive infection bacteriophage resistance protein
MFYHAKSCDAKMLRIPPTTKKQAKEENFDVFFFCLFLFPKVIKNRNWQMTFVLAFMPPILNCRLCFW